VTIEDLPIPYAAVACDIDTGEPVVFREGSLADAVRASTAIPGLFHPFRRGDRFLVDGGLIDPVPVGVCRSLGVDVVIAVDITPRPIPTTPGGRRVWSRITEQIHEGLTQQTWLPNSLTEALDSHFRGRPEGARPLPGVYSILNQSISILLQEILRLRLAVHVPDVVIRPAVSMTIMGYLHAEDGIHAGEAAAEAALPEIRRILADRGRSTSEEEPLRGAGGSDMIDARGEE
jgi:NTE family protein